MKKKIIMIFILVISIASQGVDAVTSSIGATIYGKETTSDYGHVISFRNTGSEDLHRKHEFSLKKFYVDTIPYNYDYITLAPNDGIQTFKKDTLTIKLEYLRNKAKFEDIASSNKLELKFLVTKDGQTFNDVTSELIYNEEDMLYTYKGDLKGYKVRFINKVKDDIVKDQIDVEINHDISLNYQNMNESQKAGREKLESWKDSRDSNDDPTDNLQNIFVVQPNITGQIKYQELKKDNEIPSWDSAKNKANVKVNLYEKIGDQYNKIATTKTNIDGKFIFSNLQPNESNFYISDTSNELYYDIEENGYSQWKVSDGLVNNLNDKKISIGRISDISRYQSVFEEAFSKTNWNDAYKDINILGKNALDQKYILTDIEKIIPKEKGLVEVFYQDESKNNLASKVMLKGDVGAKYKSNELKIKGYKLKEVRGKEEGIYTKEQQRVIYIYEKENKTKKIVKTGSTVMALAMILGVLASTLVVMKNKIEEY